MFDSALIDAVKKQAADEVTKIIHATKKEERAALINQLDDTGKAAIHHASAAGNIIVIDLLLSFPGAQYAKPEWKIMPTHIAAEKGHYAVLKYFLDKKVKTDHATTDKNFTALHFAAEQGHMKCVELLLFAGANPLLKTTDNQTPLDLTSNDAIKQLLSAICPSMRLLAEAARIPFLQKTRSQQVVNWPRYGAEWERFKTTLQAAFEHEDENVSRIVRIQCQSIVNVSRNKQAAIQFLYYLCAAGIDDVVDFLIDHGIDFTQSTYQGISSVSSQGLGLYAAIDYGKLNVVKVLLKNNDRIWRYLYPANKPNNLSPLQFAEQKLKEHGKDASAGVYQLIIQYLKEKEKIYHTLKINPPEDDAQQGPPAKRQRIMGRSINFTPDISPQECQLRFVKTAPAAAVNNNAEGEPDGGNEDFASEEIQEAFKRYRSEVGIWGEAALFFKLKQKYQKKYNGTITAETENGFVIEGVHTQKGKIRVSVTWPNKKLWEEWGNSKTSPFVDPATQPYDIKIEKTMSAESKVRYGEVKTTTSERQAIASLTRNEFYFMLENAQNYCLYRCYRAGARNAFFRKDKMLPKQLLEEKGIVKEVKFIC